MKELKGLKIEGSTFNNEKYVALQDEYWRPTDEKDTMYCILHNIYFNQEGYEGEPCWRCYESCKEED